MPELSPHPILILGVGNPLRRDDGAGPAVVRRLAGRLPPGVEARRLSGEALELMAAWQGAGSVLVVDAVSSGAAAGTLHRLDATAGPLPATLTSASSHGLGAAQAVELARALGRLPERLVFYGIEGGDFTPGEGLTPVVEEAVAKVAEEIVGRLTPAAGAP